MSEESKGDDPVEKLTQGFQRLGCAPPDVPAKGADALGRLVELMGTETDVDDSSYVSATAEERHRFFAKLCDLRRAVEFGEKYMSGASSLAELAKEAAGPMETSFDSSEGMLIVI